MAKPPKESYDLSDAEKRDLIQLIQQGKALPEKYRFLLFEDKREVELVWNGKNREVCTTVLPFQSLEHVDEPRQEAPESPQFGLFDTRGRQLKGWTNKLIWGDNKLILSSLKSGALRRQIEDAGGLKLIYIDPPFDVGADFSMDIEIGGETFHKEPNLLEQIAYRDTWGRGADSFISMIYERLILMRDLMAEDGSIYVHMGAAVSHYVRNAMDEVFGSHRFINEVIWKRGAAHSDTAQGSAHYGRIHDTVLFYAMGDRYLWNPQYEPYDQEYIDTFYRHVEKSTGRRFRTDNLTAAKPGGDTSYEWKGVRPYKGRYWAYSRAKMEAFEQLGRLVYTKSGMPTYKRYLDEMPGRLAQDLWTEIKVIGAGSTERADYPTQKPETLLARIIKTSSNEGDLVADFFCGSGTTAAVAEKLGRKWICTDLGKFGIHTTRKRLIQVQRALKDSGKPFRAFEVLNLGRYERQAYLGVNFSLDRHSRESGNPEAEELDARLRGHDGVVLSREERRRRLIEQKEREFRDLILRAYKAQPLEGESFFHGKNAGRLVVVGPINLPVGRLFVEEVITECRKRGASRVDVLAFEFEMGLFPAVLEEARQKGIDLVPKQIPPEVFDKRAVEKGQVVFFDISFIEATPRYHKKDKFTLQIELTDFSVYYTQGAAETAATSMKNGKSEVVCEQGSLIKVSKDKDGVVTRDILTRNWTDWVDYWAVDFDYMSRKEIIKVAVDADAPSQVLPHFPEEEGSKTAVGWADAGSQTLRDDVVPVGLRTSAQPTSAPLPQAGEGGRRPGEGEFEERWTGSFIFENEWQSFRTRKNRNLEIISAAHTYTEKGRYTVAVKVIDIFGNDTMVLVPVNVG